MGGLVRPLVLVTALLSASPGSAAEISAASVKTLSRLLTASLAKHDGFEVSSSQELQAVVALQGEKQAVGCDEDATSCLAEVAGAMGARYVVFGQVGDVEDILIMTLQLFDSEQGKSVARIVVQRASATELIEALPVATDDLLKKGGLLEQARSGGGKQHLLVLDLQLQASAPATAPPVTAQGEDHALLWLGGAVAAAGATALVGAGAFYGLALATDAAAVAEPVQTTAAAHLDTRDTQVLVAGGLALGSAALFAVGGGVVGASFLLEGE